ncbi:ABC transporter permease [Emticicia sp.]|uniref:ABC transporter permease n=1 Tax=Emticicia sp. TaxID=1930953 RepID=UPI0037513403
MIRNYIKIAFRNLVRNKVFSFINIAGLAIGLTAAMLILLYTKDEVSYDKFHVNNPNIYRITNAWIKPDGSINNKGGNTGDFQGPKFKAQIPEIEAFVRIQSQFKDIRTKDEIKGYEMLAADTNFFSVFSFPLASGNPATALQKPNTIVISEEMAEKFFKTKDVLGKTLELKEGDKFIPYQITGISKKCPQNSSVKFDFLLPKIVAEKEYSNNENWFNFFQNTFVLLNAKADKKLVEAKMKQVYDADAAEAIKMMAAKYNVKEKAVYALQPLLEMHLSTDYPAQNGLVDASNPTFSYILMGIALFILLIACINFVNLTVARSLKRAKEIGVRKVVGSNRKQLIWQFLGESFLLSFVAFIMAILLLQLVLPTFNQLANKALSFSYLLDAKLVVAYFGAFVLTSLLSGFYPAIMMSGFSPVETLYNRFNLSGKNYLQKSLVVLQFGLASFLIIATLTIFSQFNYLINKDLGYKDENVIMVDFGQNIFRDKAVILKDQLLKNPNIVQVAPKNGGNWGTVAQVNGKTDLQFAYETVDEDYLPLYKIKIIEGRNFSKDFADSTNSVIVNEAFVKKAGWKKPIGQVINFFYRDNEKYMVVGVVKDYHYDALTQEIKPQMFTMKSNGFGMVHIKIKPNSETASLAHIEKNFKSLFPINPYSYRFRDLVNKKAYESEEKWKQIMLFGAALTIFISCIGLFGLATLSAEKRTKEIGIRKVLGASISSIVALLSTDFIKLVGLSFVLSFPVAYYATQKWLENYPYRESFNGWIFAFTAAITICIALITVGWQSIRAAMMNPVKSLKTE